MLQENSQVPLDTIVKDIEGKDTTLEKYLGNYLVLYFYPKDNTPGCNQEACEFRDFNEDIKKLGVNVVGVSSDTVKSHQKFKANHRLNFDLLSDRNHSLQEAFGVWGEKTMFGRTFMGTIRSTFVINPEGKVIKVWEKVSPEGHAEEVFKYLTATVNKI